MTVLKKQYVFDDDFSTHLSNMILFDELIMSVRVGVLPLDANENIWTSRDLAFDIILCLKVTQVWILFEELRIFGRWQNLIRDGESFEELASVISVIV